MALTSCSTPSLTWSLNALFGRAVGGEVTIGRSPDCTLMITTDSLRVPQAGAPLMLSRNHAKLAVRDGHLQLWDCGSVNGTWVNTQQIERRVWKVVHDGDVLTFGGPPEIKQSGVLQPNPWRFKVKKLHEFLASYTPTQHLSGLPPVPSQQPAVELFRFNNGAVPAAAAAAASAAAEGFGDSSPSPERAAGLSVPVAGPSAAAANTGPAAAQDPTQEFFRFGSGPALAVAVPPGGPPDDALPEQGSPPAGLQDVAMPPLQAPQPVSLQHAEPLLQPPFQGAASEPLAVRPAVLAVRADRGQNTALPADAAQRCPCGGTAQQAPSAGGAAGGADVIDLTLDEDSPVVSPQRRRIPASLRPGASAAALQQQQQQQQEVVVLAESPPKRRDHDTLQRQANQLKRAKPSGDAKPAYIEVEAAGPSSAAAAQPADPVQQEHASASGQPAAAAAGVDAAAAAGAGAGASSDLMAIQSQFTCAICQEMVVHCVTMVPCGHMFCGECLASWLEKKKDCPTCRQTGTAPPVWMPPTDCICNDVLEKQLGAQDLEERQRRKQAWEENKASLEQKLKGQWEQRTSGRGAAGRQRGGGNRGGNGGSGVEQDLLGFAGMLQMMIGGGPIMAPELYATGLQGQGGHWEQAAAYEPRTVRRGPQIRDAMPPLQTQRRAGFQPPPPPPPPPAVRHHFRVDYSAPRSHTACNACRGLLNNNVLRIAATSPPSGRRGSSVQSHYHLDCVPQHYWAEMRITGVENMRGVSASDQALLRMRQQAGR